MVVSVIYKHISTKYYTYVKKHFRVSLSVDNEHAQVLEVQLI